MLKELYLIVLVGVLVVFTACENNEGDQQNSNTEIENQDPEVNNDYEGYIDAIDFNDSLGIANSLSYSNQAGEAVEVELYMNDSNEIVKIRELIVLPNSASILSNVFYLRNGKKVASKEFREVNENDSLYFVEYRSYYDTASNVIATKFRSAIYEELLEQEPFVMVDKKALNMDRAIRVVDQKGEFETTFQGFVEMGDYLFLVVGESKKDGFATSLIVQSYTPLINELKANEKSMLGTPLLIQFARMENEGIQQILLGVSKKPTEVE